MAEISLSVYQNKLDELLARGQFNEVIAHSRHILITYPKNLKAYSQMGQALFSASRWDEAAELFRRLLGALPNDFVAHHRLGQIYGRLEHYDDAIWHTERAYDQQPNNSEVIESLRTLYRTHRGKDVQRLQLTAGAVAQQHIRNGLYQQAVIVLNKALARYPNRVDLKVLRIRALWQAEKHLDAAEGAIEVLETLPYSLVGNRILTELWLKEQRPSDAQRYLSRIEDLDPYMAYRIATGDDAVESLITIEELDYEAISRHELATSNPDWLSTLGEVEDIQDDETDAVASLDDILQETEVEPEQPRKVTDDLENLLDDDWQRKVDALDETETSSSVSDEELDDLFGDMDADDLFGDLEDDFDDDLDDLFGDVEDEEPQEASPVRPKRSSTDELNLPEGMHTDDLPDDLLDRIEKMKGMSQNETMPAQNRPDAGLEEDDPRNSTGLTGMLSQLDAEEEDLSWLTDAQLGEFDAGDSAPDDSSGASEVDSDWLEELDELESSPDAQRVSTGLTGMFDDESNDDDLSDLLDEMDADDAPDVQSIDPDDPNAWMTASGIEFDPEAERENLFSIDDEESTFESADVNPMAWLGDDEESAEAEAAVDPTDLDPMAWMADADIELEPDTDNLSDNTPDFFEDIDDTPEAAPVVDEQWLGDDDMLDEMLSLEEEFEVTSSTDNLFGDETDDVSSIFEADGEDDEWSVDDDALDELMDFDPDDSPDTDNLMSGTDELAEDAPNFFDDLDDDDEQDDSDDDWDDDDWSDDDQDDWDDDDSGDDRDDDDDDDDGNLFEDEEDAPTIEDAWMGDEDMLDEMLSMEDDDIDFGVDDDESDTPTSEDWQDTMNDDFNNDWQPEQPDDDQDPLAWLNDADGESSSASQFSEDAGDEEVDLEDIFAEMSDEELDDDDAGLEWLETDEMAAVSAEEGADDDEGDPLGWLSEEGVELEDDAEAASTGMTDMLNALGDDDDDSELDNFLEDHEEAAEKGSWLDRVDLDELPATGDISEEWEEAEASEAEADWLAAIDDNGEFEEAEAENEVDWMTDDASESLSFEDDEESDVAFDFEAEAQTDDADDLFNFEDDADEISEFNFEPASSSADDEPDWLAAIDSASDEADEAEQPEQPDWLAQADDFEGEDDEAEAVAEQPDWLSDVSVDDGLEAEAEEAAEDTEDWLSELGEFEDDGRDDEEIELDIMDEVDDDEAEQPEQPDWLSDVAVAGAGAAAAMGASEMFEDDDESDEIADDWVAEADDFESDEEAFEFAQAADDEEDEPDWLAEAGDFEDDEEAVAEADGSDWLDEVSDEAEDEFEFAQQAMDVDDEPDWLAEADDFEDEADAVADGAGNEWLADIGAYSGEEDESAEPETVTDELNWMEDDEDPLSAETAVGATADADYLEDVDPATAASALDWMTDADEEDELLFEEPMEEQPQGITDFLNNEDEDDDLVIEEDEDGWLDEVAAGGVGAAAALSASEMFDDDDEDETEEEPEWLASADEFADEEAVAEDAPDWLDDDEEFDSEPITEGSFDYEEDDTVIGMPELNLDDDAEPAWLDGMEEGDGVQDAFADDEDDELGWETETTIGEAVSAEEPDWLDGMEDGDGVQDAFAEAADDDLGWDDEDELVEFAENSSAENEFDAINDYETEDEPDVTYEEEEDALPQFEGEGFSSAETQESQGISEDDYLADFEEDTELAPAEDAPDWLNAMVPGLDIDYEADEDEPVDQGFIGEPQASSTDKGFDWLNDIVDEETGAMAPVVPKPQPVTAPRFSFSNPPAWLNKLLGRETASSASAASVASVAQDTDDDFDDFDDDLPDWLEVDDE